MIENEILKTKLKDKINKLNINEKAKNALIEELNYLSNLLIDIYLER